MISADLLELDTTKDTNMQVASVAGAAMLSPRAEAMVYSKRVLLGILF